MKTKLFIVKFCADKLEQTIAVASTDRAQVMCDVLNHFQGVGVSADRIGFNQIEEMPVLYRRQFQQIPA